MEYKKTYVITLEGCDDETVFKMNLTEGEAILLEKVAAKANETSTYSCMPRMYIVEESEAKKFAEAGRACAEALMSGFLKIRRFTEIKRRIKYGRRLIFAVIATPIIEPKGY